MIEQNTISGNTNGIYVAGAAGENVIRDNVAVGNPAIQSSVTRPAVQAADILNLAPAGRIMFERNVCVTAVNATCSAVSRPPQ